MKRETFIAKREKELMKYGERLRNTYKRYGQFVRVKAETNNRKGREIAAGKAVLQALDALCETAAKKPLAEKGLIWAISEKKYKDENGVNVFEYEIGFNALSYDHEFTEEQIQEELKRTWEIMQKEIDERFPEE